MNTTTCNCCAEIQLNSAKGTCFSEPLHLTPFPPTTPDVVGLGTTASATSRPAAETESRCLTRIAHEGSHAHAGMHNDNHHKTRREPKTAEDENHTITATPASDAIDCVIKTTTCVDV